MKRRWKYRRLILHQAACIGLSVTLYVCLSAADRSEQKLTQGRYLERQGTGQDGKEYQIYVKGLEEEERLVSIYIQGERYTQDRALQIFEGILYDLPDQMCMDNPSLTEVRSDLRLPVWIEKQGVRLRWASDQPEILDSFGRVSNQNISYNGEEVFLQVQMSDGDHEASYEIKVMVMPPLHTKEEERLASFLQEVRAADEKGKYEQGVWLPETFDGKKLYYRKSTGANYEVLLVLGMLLAFLCYAKEQMEKQEMDKKRSRQLLLDYSEVVSKLMVLVGAGMTIRLAWEKIAEDYRNARKNKTWPLRYAYEEICYACDQMHKGVSEGQALKEFGTRCAQPCYLKLSSLLEQNRRSGIKNLRQLLHREMEDAFEQRKNLSRKAGEEASTKLLLPLFLMLGIVMTMIMAPAFLSF